MNYWAFAVGVFTIVGALIANIAFLDKIVSEKINSEINKPEFMGTLLSKIRPQFTIFDESGDIIFRTKYIFDYIDPNSIEVEKDGRTFTSISINTKEFLDYAPVLTSIDSKVEFHEPERVEPLKFVYRAVAMGGVWSDSYAEQPPPKKFKIDILIK